MAIYFTHPIKLIWVILSCVGMNACSYNGEESSFDGTINYEIDTSGIPKDTIDFNAPGLTYKNGRYYLSGEKYSGIVHKNKSVSIL